jgi:putative ABC transport system substrate-binding protein
MRRREFIVASSLAAAWPLAALAQQSGMRRIGFLGAAAPSDASQWVAAFVQRLKELGWIENQNLAIEYRWAEGRSERFAEIANEFVRSKVDVIMTWSGGPVIAAKRATTVIPIVFALQTDPGWSLVCRDQAATSVACRSSRPILSARGSNCCERLFRVSTD